jgi:hypothetical protein
VETLPQAAALAHVILGATVMNHRSAASLRIAFASLLDRA